MPLPSFFVLAPRLRRNRAAVVVSAVALVAAAGVTAPSSSFSFPGLQSSAHAATARQTVTVSVPAGLNTAPFDVARTLTVPAGWTASVFARIPSARFITVTPSGDALVSQPSTGKVEIIRPTGQVSDFVTGLTQPHDMLFAPVDGAMNLFISQSNKVVRYPYSNGDLTARAGTAVVDGLPNASTPELGGAYAHALKNIAVTGDTLYVSIASTCNACVEDTVSDPLRAAIYRYDANGHNANRALVVHGLRNAEGLAFVPGTTDLWAVANNRDNIAVPDNRDVDGDGVGDYAKVLTAYVDNHPPEEFVHVTTGAFFGWPFCNPSPDTTLRNMPFDRDVQFNADGSKADCATATPVTLGIQAHSAPLGLTFTQGTTAPDLGAIVALHGSWNRSVPTGYKLVNFPWTAGGPGDQQDFVTGWLSSDGTSTSSWGRPVDTVVDRDGSILATDDASGTVYRLRPPAASSTAGTIKGIGGACIDVSGSDTGATGAPVQLWSCLTGAVDQHWTANANGTLTTLGKCMDVRGGGTANGTKVQLWDCNGTGAQQWRRSGTTGTLWQNPQSGRCLDDPASNTANGTQLILWSCRGAANQQWIGPTTGS